MLLNALPKSRGEQWIMLYNLYTILQILQVTENLWKNLQNSAD